jgi:hypothetical protein
MRFDGSLVHHLAVIDSLPHEASFTLADEERSHHIRGTGAANRSDSGKKRALQSDDKDEDHGHQGPKSPKDYPDCEANDCHSECVLVLILINCCIRLTLLWCVCWQVVDCSQQYRRNTGHFELSRQTLRILQRAINQFVGSRRVSSTQ